MQLGMIGLGRMGANMVRRLQKNGHQCVVYDHNPALGAALALLYPGTFAARALSRRAELGAFEVLQSAAVVTIGAAIAIAAASAGGFTLEPVGVGALVLGAAAYAAALGLSDRPDGPFHPLS